MNGTTVFKIEWTINNGIGLTREMVEDAIWQRYRDVTAVDVTEVTQKQVTLTVLEPT